MVKKVAPKKTADKTVPAKKPVAKKPVAKKPVTKAAPKKPEAEKAPDAKPQASLKDLAPSKVPEPLKAVEAEVVQETPKAEEPLTGTQIVEPEAEKAPITTNEDPEGVNAQNINTNDTDETPTLLSQMEEQSKVLSAQAKQEGFRVGNRYDYRALLITDLKISSGDGQKSLCFEPLEVKNLLEFFTKKEILASRMLMNRMLPNPKLGGRYGELLEITEGMDGVPKEMIISLDHFNGVNVQRQVEGMGGVGILKLQTNDNNFYAQAIKAQQKKEEEENAKIGQDVT